MKRLENKVAIVTGGALGIGKATAIMMAKEGAHVAVCDLLEEEGKLVVEEIKQSGGQAEFWALDVTDEAMVKSVTHDINSTFGKIDILVNNAGIAGINLPTDQVSAEDWDKVMDVNVNGVFYCTKHAIPYLKKSKAASIINLSSIYGLVGAPDVPPYHASKGAVREMSKTDAMIYAKDNIRVNSVHPGYIWTPMVEGHLQNSGIDLETGKKDLASLHPIGKVGIPDDIAFGIVYLASDESGFVTGSELVIDGGYTAH